MGDKLAGVHPELAGKVQQILSAMAILGHPMMVTAGYRTVQEQTALYAQGRTAPGHIVTQCDGIAHPSRHQADPRDGFGRAVDCCFVVDGAPSWAESCPWDLYGAMAEALRLHWGGHFTSFRDRPHVEMNR